MKNLTMLLLLTLSMSACASGTTKNSSKTNKAVQRAMKSYVNELTQSNQSMPVIYKGKVLKLNVAKSDKYPDGFHSGVKTKGDLFVSCADFVDQKGNKYDIDFLVNKTQNRFVVVQPIVHSVNGTKNPYDLKH